MKFCKKTFSFGQYMWDFIFMNYNCQDDSWLSWTCLIPIFTQEFVYHKKPLKLGVQAAKWCKTPALMIISKCLHTYTYILSYTHIYIWACMLTHTEVCMFKWLIQGVCSTFLSTFQQTVVVHGLTSKCLQGIEGRQFINKTKRFVIRNIVLIW